jgi:hypothetical protein
MTPSEFAFGLYVNGPTRCPRQLVDWGRLNTAAATVAPPFDPAAEGYLTAFRFDRAMAAHLKATDGSSAGFDGPVWSPTLHFDLDAEADLAAALVAGRRLASVLLERYRKLSDDDLELFFSGGRSVHLGLPMTHGPAPGPLFHRVCGRLASRLAKLAGVDAVGGVKFDGGVYDRVRLWRLVNSLHPRTGLHKVRLSYDELIHLDADGVRKIAAAPQPFDPPTCPVGDIIGELEHDWEQVAAAVARETEERAARKAAEAVAGGPERLNRLTLDFIARGADYPDRHRTLYSSARNLAEFGCPPRLALALLLPAALDSGLGPSEARRQIDCGLRDEPPHPSEGG